MRSTRSLSATRLILRIAPTSLPVLVRGPRASGKELVARALRAASGRRGQLALFAHVRGGFAGAVDNAFGYRAEADRGTVFLDEVGDIPLSNQRKLLRAIERLPAHRGVE